MSKAKVVFLKTGHSTVVGKKSVFCGTSRTFKRTWGGAKRKCTHGYSHKLQRCKKR